MTDKEILSQFVGLMEDMLESDELQLKHVKQLNRKIDLIWEALPALIALACLPDIPEKDEVAERLHLAYKDPELLIEGRKILAQHESLHERRADFLARLKEKIAGL